MGRKIITRLLIGGLQSKSLFYLHKHKHACKTGHSDPRGEQWLIFHQAQIEASFWVLPSGIGLSSVSVSPQLLDGSTVWLSAKRNVYTNMHNCSVRSHSELTILRRGAVVRCRDFRKTGAQRSSGKQARWVLNLVAVFEVKTQTIAWFVIKLRWIHLQQQSVQPGTVKSRMVCSLLGFKVTCLQSHTLHFCKFVLSL